MATATAIWLNSHCNLRLHMMQILWISRYAHYPMAMTLCDPSMARHLPCPHEPRPPSNKFAFRLMPTLTSPMPHFPPALHGTHRGLLLLMTLACKVNQLMAPHTSQSQGQQLMPTLTSPMPHLPSALHLPHCGMLPLLTLACKVNQLLAPHMISQPPTCTLAPALLSPLPHCAPAPHWIYQSLPSILTLACKVNRQLAPPNYQYQALQFMPTPTSPIPHFHSALYWTHWNLACKVNQLLAPHT